MPAITGSTAHLATPVPGRPLALRRGTLLALIPNIVFGIAQWGILKVTAKIGSPILLGKLVLATGILAPLVSLFSLNLRAIYATASPKEADYRLFLKVRAYSSLAAFGFIIGIAISARQWTQMSIAEFIAIGLFKLVESGLDILSAYPQRLEDMARMSQVTTFRTVAGYGSVVITFLLYPSLAAAFTAGTVGFFVYSLAFEVPLIQVRPVSPAKSTVRYILLAGIPMAMTLGVTAGAQNIPRYILSGFVTLDRLAAFAASLQFAFIGSMICAAVSSAASPRLARLYHSGNIGAVRRLYGKMLVADVFLTFLFAVVAIPFSKVLIASLFTRDIAEIAPNLAWTSLYMLCYTIDVHAGVLVTACGIYVAQLPVQLGKLLIVSVAGLLLAQKWMLVGGIIALCLGCVCSAVVLTVLGFRSRQEGLR